jgi:hypothetical protein
LARRELPVPTLSFLRESRRVLKRMRRRLALLPGRRFESSKTGLVDFSSTIRQSLANPRRNTQDTPTPQKGD